MRFVIWFLIVLEEVWAYCSFFFAGVAVGMDYHLDKKGRRTIRALCFNMIGAKVISEILRSVASS